jgi:hypothetical protein
MRDSFANQPSNWTKYRGRPGIDSTGETWGLVLLTIMFTYQTGESRLIFQGGTLPRSCGTVVKVPPFFIFLSSSFVTFDTVSSRNALTRWDEKAGLRGMRYAPNGSTRSRAQRKGDRL